MERCVMITVGALEQGGASIRTVIGDKLLLIVWANGEVGIVQAHIVGSSIRQLA
jgi:hypothetical protein